MIMRLLNMYTTFLLYYNGFLLGLIDENIFGVKHTETHKKNI